MTSTFRTSIARVALSAAVLGSTVLGNIDAARAAEPTKEECIAANEGGQALRRTGKLTEARTKLLLCAVASCPTVLRDDCAERLTNVEKAIPTVVLTARDPDGHDVTAVKVTLDGAPLVDHLDGSALRVNPGEHTFELSADGFHTASRKLVVSEGEKGRREVVALEPLVARAPGAAPSGAAPERAIEPRGGGARTVAFVLGGAGVIALGVGGFFGLSAISKNHSAGCDADNVCTNAQARRDAQGMANASTISFVAGTALVAGGVVLFLTSGGDGKPSASSAATAWEAAPMFGAGAGGISLRKGW